MKRPLSRHICLILCILLTCGSLFTTSFAANDDITLTAVNANETVQGMIKHVTHGGKEADIS